MTKHVLICYNNKMKREKTVIGRAEKINFPVLGFTTHARIDTGAKTSSIWALSAEEVKDGLMAVFPVPDSDDTVMHVFPHYTKVIVSSSMGHEQLRYKVKMSAKIRKRRIFATFTLSDRSTQVYPVLIGRATLNGKFVVDVAKGYPLKEQEEARSKVLQSKVKEQKI